MADHNDLGKMGEELAVNYLIEKGVCFRKGKHNSTTCTCF